MNVYVETSVWNMYLDAEPVNRDKRALTERFFAQAGKGLHRLFISPLIRAEIAADPDLDHGRVLAETVDQWHPDLLDETKAVLDLGREYVGLGTIPVKYQDDAVHVAYAVVYELDAIVSWNLAHILKVKTRRLVAEYNKSVGLHIPRIITPKQVIDDGEDDGRPSQDSRGTL